DVDGSQGLLSPAQEDHSPGFGGEHLGGGQGLVFGGDLDVVDVGASVPDGTAGLALGLDDAGGDEGVGHGQAVGELGRADVTARQLGGGRAQGRGVETGEFSPTEERGGRGDGLLVCLAAVDEGGDILGEGL